MVNLLKPYPLLDLIVIRYIYSTLYYQGRQSVILLHKGYLHDVQLVWRLTQIFDEKGNAMGRRETRELEP